MTDTKISTKYDSILSDMKQEIYQIENYNSKRSSIYNFFALVTVFGISFTVLTFIFNLQKLSMLGLTIAILGGIAAFIYSNGYLSYSSKEMYYAAVIRATGSSDHLCLYCGNKGIWRKGVYASSTVNCNCSKCKNYLFRE